MGRTLIILVLVLAGLGTLLFFERTDEQNAPLGGALVGLSVEQVARLTINGPLGTLDLLQTDGTWRLTQPVGARADQDAVLTALTTLTHLASDGVISSNPDKAELFEVTGPNTIQVEFFGPGDVQPKVTLMVGKLAPGYSHTFVSRAGEDAVHRALGPVRFLLERGADAWRDRQVLDVDPEQVTQLTFHGAEELSLARRDGTWRIVTEGIDATGTVVPQGQVMRVLSLLTGLRAEAFVPAPDNAATPLMSVSLWVGDAANPIDLTIEAEQGAAAYRVVAEADPQRYLVPQAGLVELVTDPLAALLPAEAQVDGP